MFGATTLASGLGIVAYVLAWWLLPAEGADAAPAVSAAERRSARKRRAALEVGSGLAVSSSRSC